MSLNERLDMSLDDCIKSSRAEQKKENKASAANKKKRKAPASNAKQGAQKKKKV